MIRESEDEGGVASRRHLKESFEVGLLKRPSYWLDVQIVGLDDLHL